MKASEYEKKEKGGFWGTYKFLVIGIIGALLLTATLSIQNFIVSYTTTDGTQYAAKLDYSLYGMCIRCYPASTNSNDIVEKGIFFATGKKKSIVTAIQSLSEIAGEEGTIKIQASGLMSPSKKSTDEMITYLESLGYSVSAVTDESEP